MSSGYDAQTPIDNEKESQVPDLPDAKLRADNPHTNNPTIPRLPSLPAMQTTRLNTSSSADPEKHAVEHAERVAGDEDGGAASPASSTASTASNHSLAAFATPGRPDTAQVIRREVAATPREKRVLVAACGPKGLMRVVRNTTADCIKGDGPAVELHCEQFGW